MEFLSRQGVQADEFHKFADNAAAQNTIQFMLYRMQFITITGIIGAKTVKNKNYDPGANQIST